jgi:DNA-binding LytR/AlgR family response regulator
MNNIKTLEEPYQITEPEVSSSLTGLPPPEWRSVRAVSGHEILSSPLLEVYYFEAQGKYTRVVLNSREGILNMGISKVAATLPKYQFQQVHRSFIVNMAKIKTIKTDEFGRMILYISDRNDKIHVSKTQEHLFRTGIF